MTVQNTPNFIDYVGDDSTTSFPFTFRVDDVSWLSVDFTDDFDQFVLNVDQDSSPGGVANYTVAPPSPGMGGPDPSFRILRTVPATQNLDYTRYDPFDSESSENALDKLTMILQDQVTIIAVGDATLQSQIDANNLLITTGSSPGHTHVEADITDLGNYTSRTVDEDIVGFWEFINVSGLAVYDAGKAAGGRISIQTGAIEILPLLATTHTRVNGPLAVSNLGITADEFRITHTGADVLLNATNAADLQLTGFTGRITQGGETYAYLSDIVAAGLLPPATDTGAMIYFDGALYNVTGSGGPGPGTMLWDPVAAQLVLTNPSGGTANPVLQLNLGNNPSAAITIDTTLSTNYVALRMNDQTGGNYFLLRHDYGLSSPNHEFRLESSQFGTIWEIENEGNLYLGGQESTSLFAIAVTANNGEIWIRNGATLYMEDVPAAQADNTNQGQLYVLDADGGLYYKFNATAAIRLDIAGGGVPGGADTQIQFNNAGAFGGSANLVWTGANVDIGGTGQLVFQGAAHECIVLFPGDYAIGVEANATYITSNQFIRFYEDNADGGATDSFQHDTQNGNTVITGTLSADLDGLGLFLTNNGAGTEILGISATGAGGIDFDFTNVSVVNFNNGDVYDYSNHLIRSVSSLYLQERAASQGDIVNQGQFWVANTSPNRPIFTDGDGGQQLLDPSLSEIISIVADYTFTLADKGKTASASGVTAAQTFTIPAGASVAFQIGTFLGFNNDSTQNWSIAITTDTLIFADDGSTGTRTLAPGGYAVAHLVAANTWKISGAQLT